MTAAIGAGRCALCGHVGEFTVTDAPTRETHLCTSCGGSLRYRMQAAAIAATYGRADATFVELLRQPDFRDLDIYEPGVSGPFRRYFAGLRGYVTSYFWPDVELGDERDGVRCEDLRNLTFPDDAFDLVISSDIFEHVRGPREGFAEILRVLRPGGFHVFTVPVVWPFQGESVPRVDWSGPTDVHLLPPTYHGSPHDPMGSLVYTDFAMDLPDLLLEVGFQVMTHHGYRQAVTFCARKPAR